ncbi:MAG: hypothetical protein KC708_16615 [Anaerolineae bacterium]|nr:hypothetical protein [Anaerolineae bacterium]
MNFLRKPWLIVLIVCLALVGAVSAQDETAFCDNLSISSADCELYLRAFSNPFNSVAFDLDMSMHYDSDTFGDPIHMAVVGTVSIDPEVRAELSDPNSDIFDSPIQALQQAIGAVNTRADIAIDIPDWSSDGYSMVPDRLRIGMALIDSVGYIDFSDLHILAPDEIPDGWYGMDIRPFVPIIFGQMNPFQVQPDPSVSMNMMYPLEGFEMVRLPDVMIDGRPAAVLQGDADLGAIYNGVMGDAYRDMLRDMYAEMGVSPAQSDALIETLFAMYENMTMSMISIIDVETAYLYTLQVDIDMPFSGETWERLFGPGADMSSFMRGISMTMTLEMRDHNATAPATAPEDAEIIPFTEVMPLLLGRDSG